MRDNFLTERTQILKARRAFLGQSAVGLGSIAISSLMSDSLAAAATVETRVPFPTSGVVRQFHVPPKVKRVIFLYMSGGPSQFETFDFKPELEKMDGQPMPDSFTNGQPIAQLQGQRLVCLRPLTQFRKYGESGQEVSDFLPNIAAISDDICIVRSMQTDQINHDPAHTLMNTGTSLSGRPSMGSWILYGLGSMTQDLPGFIVLTSESARSPQPISNRMWHSGFLPGHLQGIKLQSRGDPVYYLNAPAGVNAQRQKDIVDATSSLDQARRDLLDVPEIDSRIRQYEMAFKMQVSIPGLMDFSEEPQHIFDLYGTKGADGSFAANCLLARRLAERGVRFIQLYHRGWDHHNNLVDFMKVSTGSCDGPSAALLKDLKQRGMLDETLIIWSGEFGRTPMAQSNKGLVGRDHHIRSFSLWLAGGGIRRGTTYGSTDELGYAAVENIVHVHDLHATILHLLGIEHEKLIYRFQGRDFRLTDIAGQVVRPMLS